jgi:glucose-6-phosphate isomerase
MTIQHSADQARESLIGTGGISASGIDAALVEVGHALDRLRLEADGRSLALLGLPAETSDLPIITDAATRLLSNATTDVVFLGTGGSSLGGQTLAQLADYAVPGVSRLSDGPRVHFLDNLDPISFAGILDKLPLPTARFVAISKSGGTGETLLQTMAVIAALEAAGLGGDIGSRILGLSEPESGGKVNALRALLAPYGATFLDHHTGVGGRFSVLTNVGLLPAAVLGLDIAAIRQGAGDALAPLLQGAKAADIAPALGAALNIAAMREGKNITVLMGYADRLERLTRWWVQLWAESIGKDGKGSQPVAALGPVDQHSQQQLYLAGPADKLFTVVTVDARGKGPVIDPALAGRCDPAFGGKTIGDLVAAQSLAMVDTFVRNHRPVRRIHCDALHERSLGHLLMHFMLETILTGYALGIDPFDQPAVEEAKILAKRYLAEGKGA